MRRCRLNNSLVHYQHRSISLKEAPRTCRGNEIQPIPTPFRIWTMMISPIPLELCLNRIIKPYARVWMANPKMTCEAGSESE